MMIDPGVTNKLNLNHQLMEVFPTSPPKITNATNAPMNGDWIKARITCFITVMSGANVGILLNGTFYNINNSGKHL